MHTHQDTSRLQHKTLAASLGNWHYAVSHEGEKAILFLHGANSSHLVWHKQFGVAVEGYKNIFVDLLGYGKSDKPETGYSLSGWIAGLHQILQQEKVSEVCIVAHSNGVIFAKEFYRTYPQRVKQLVLLDGMLKLTLKEPVLAWMKATLARSDYEEFMASNVERMPLHGLGEADKALLRQDALQTPKYVVAAEFAVVSDPATWKEMQIDCPTTIVHANNPSWDESYLAALKKIAPQHELLNWTDAGHFIPMQYPERLHALISSLLTRRR